MPWRLPSGLLFLECGERSEAERPAVDLERTTRGEATDRRDEVVHLRGDLVAESGPIDDVESGSLGGEPGDRIGGHRCVEEFQQLAAVVRLEEVIAAEKELYPAWPSKAPALRAWLEPGRALGARDACRALAEEFKAERLMEESVRVLERVCRAKLEEART